jgi:putative ABC transport system permease protein
MFDLERKIKEWKRSLLKQDVFEDGLLAEIESHLRDAFDEGRSAGLNEASAFQAAVDRVGPADRIASEQRKNRELALNRRSPLRLGRIMPALVQSYVRSALRSVRRGKGLALINIAGLSVGLATFSLVLLFVQYEFRYEKHHVNAGRIYRLIMEQNLGDRTFRARSTPVPLAETLRASLPEVEDFARFFPRGRIIVVRGDRSLVEEGFNFCDSGALRMFTYPLLKGSRETAFARSASAVITESAARKYFGDEDPIGQTLTLDFGASVDVTVTGVMADHPPTTDFAPQILCPLELLRAVRPAPETFFENWYSNQIYSYILVRDGQDPAALEKKIIAAIRPRLEEGARKRILLESLATAHLRPLDSPDGGGGRTRTLAIFILCGFLVLLTACINFMNLATARSASRAREVGLRKVAGAARSDLVRQFLGESLIYAFVSLAVALVLAVLALPLLNSLTGQQVRPADLGRSSAVLILLGAAVVTGLLSGSYPALYLSGLRPVRVFKSRGGDGGPKGAPLRKVLVVAQFTISIILIISTLIFGRQLRYVQDKPLGFDKDRILVLRTASGPVVRDIAPLRAALLRDPRIAGVCGSEQLPSSIGMYNDVTWEGAGPNEKIELMFNRIDYDFLDTFGIKLVAGRNFSPEFPGDSSSDGATPQSARGIILNEEAVRRMGWTDPIGRQVIEDYPDGKTYMNVVGVVRDFHFASLRSAVQPMNFFLSTRINRFVSIRIGGGDLRGAVGSVEAAWKRLCPSLPVDSFFLDAAFDRYYQSDNRQRGLFGVLSLLAVSIACLGLFGLAAHAAEQRTKEIGIRKALGASTPGIVRLLSWELIRWVLAANLLAWPVAYLFLRGWLKGFAYRIDLSAQWLWFVGAAVLSLVVAWLTVGFQAVKAAAAKPVKSLRYE